MHRILKFRMYAENDNGFAVVYISCVMNVVFLNLADNDPQGITAKSVKALKVKYAPVEGLRKWIFGDNTVTEYNLIPLLSGGQPKRGADDVTTTSVKEHCSRA